MHLEHERELTNLASGNMRINLSALLRRLTGSGTKKAVNAAVII